MDAANDRLQQSGASFADIMDKLRGSVARIDFGDEFPLAGSYRYKKVHLTSVRSDLSMSHDNCDGENV
jgi:hypothetical protein